MSSMMDMLHNMEFHDLKMGQSLGIDRNHCSAYKLFVNIFFFFPFAEGAAVGYKSNMLNDIVGCICKDQFIKIKCC